MVDIYRATTHGARRRARLDDPAAPWVSLSDPDATIEHMFESLLEARPGPGVQVIAAVLSRDRTCTFPGCAVPAFRCDLDHVRRPSPPGPGATQEATDVGPDELISLCRHHHVVRARHGWRPELAADGTVRWTSPTGHRYVRERLGVAQNRESPVIRS